MTYLLDTNVCIRYLNGRAPSVLQRLQALQPAEIVVCVKLHTEMYHPLTAIMCHSLTATMHQP